MMERPSERRWPSRNAQRVIRLLAAGTAAVHVASGSRWPAARADGPPDRPFLACEARPSVAWPSRRSTAAPGPGYAPNDAAGAAIEARG